MAQASVNVRMDADVKQQFEKFCDKVGMSMSTAINIFAKQVIQEQRIPFIVSAVPSYPRANLNTGSRQEQELINAGMENSPHTLNLDDPEAVEAFLRESWRQSKGDSGIPHEMVFDELKQEMAQWKTGTR